MSQLNELGFYVLAGAPQSPAELIDEVAAGEALGLGSTFISERFNIKEARHALGRGRRGVVDARDRDRRDESQHAPPDGHRVARDDDASAHRRALHARTRPRHRAAVRRATASRAITTAQIEDFVGLMRRLWKGEVIFGHDGPAGKFPVLHLDAVVRRGHPARLRRVRPELARAGGPCFDAVVLHTFFTDETVRALRRDRAAGGRARPDAIPPSVRIWSCYATIGDHLPEALRLKKTVGRLATYLQGYGDLLVATERLGSRRCWPASAPTRSCRRSRRARREGRHRGARARRDAAARRVARAGRDRRRRSAARRGCCASSTSASTASSCTARRPTELDPVVEAYRAIRPPNRFDGWLPNPGRRSTAGPSAGYRVTGCRPFGNSSLFVGVFVGLVVSGGA